MESILVALIGGAVTLAGVVASNSRSRAVLLLLSQFFQLTEEEIACIRYHMGAFTPEKEWNDYTRAVKMWPNVLWTHHADMLASHVEGV